MPIVAWVGFSILVALGIRLRGRAGSFPLSLGISALLVTPVVLGFQRLVLASVAGPSGGYSTEFAATEDPLSERGSWIEGGTTGLDWGNVRTMPGRAFGVSLPSLYGDPTAVLAGTWASDQQAQATVRTDVVPKRRTHEVELRLRTTIAPHRITGYEIDCSIDDSHPHIEIVRWNGPLNDFTYVKTAPVSCANGDILKATAIGNVITVYKNGAKVVQGTDGTFTNGSPGIGFYDSVDRRWAHFGFSKFSAGNIP